MRKYGTPKSIWVTLVFFGLLIGLPLLFVLGHFGLLPVWAK